MIPARFYVQTPSHAAYKLGELGSSIAALDDLLENANMSDQSREKIERMACRLLGKMDEIIEKQCIQKMPGHRRS